MNGLVSKGSSTTSTGGSSRHTALIGASTVAPLVAAQAIGSFWSGAPNAAAVMGTALGTLALGSLMIRWAAAGHCCSAMPSQVSAPCSPSQASHGECDAVKPERYASAVTPTELYRSPKTTR